MSFGSFPLAQPCARIAPRGGWALREPGTIPRGLHILASEALDACLASPSLAHRVLSAGGEPKSGRMELRFRMADADTVFWLGHADGNLLLLGAIARDARTAEELLEPTVRRLWSGGWSLTLKATGNPAEPQTLVTARCAKVSLDEATTEGKLTPSGLFWAVDIASVLQQCLLCLPPAEGRVPRPVAVATAWPAPGLRGLKAPPLK